MVGCLCHFSSSYPLLWCQPWALPVPESCQESSWAVRHAWDSTGEGSVIVSADFVCAGFSNQTNAISSCIYCKQSSGLRVGSLQDLWTVQRLKRRVVHVALQEGIRAELWVKPHLLLWKKSFIVENVKSLSSVGPESTLLVGTRSWYLVNVLVKMYESCWKHEQNCLQCLRQLYTEQWITQSVSAVVQGTAKCTWFCEHRG